MVPAWSSTPGELPRCAVGSGQPDGLAGVCAASCSIVCLSPAILPERILVVLCGQEKPQLFNSSKVSLVLWATVFFYTLLKMERERPCRQGEFGCLIFILCESRRLLSWGQQPEPLEVSQIVLNLVKDSCCQHPFTVSFIYWILNQPLICFTRTVWSCPCHQSRLPSKLLKVFI